MKSRQFSVTVDEAVYDRVAAMAAAERRSVSGMAAVLLFAGLRDPVLGERYVPESLSAKQKAAAEAARTRDREWQLEASRNTRTVADVLAEDHDAPGLRDAMNKPARPWEVNEPDRGTATAGIRVPLAGQSGRGADGTTEAPNASSGSLTSKRSRTKPCVHRISPEAFCKLCD